jgi:hypothetical protein
MRQPSEFFEGAELDLLYMARRLRDALRLEQLLDQHGMNYYVETGVYTGGFLFRRELTGAFFYVAPSDLLRARELLLANSYKPYTDSA